MAVHGRTQAAQGSVASDAGAEASVPMVDLFRSEEGSLLRPSLPEVFANGPSAAQNTTGLAWQQVP
jgi:hypothetical protein